MKTKNERNKCVANQNMSRWLPLASLAKRVANVNVVHIQLTPIDQEGDRCGGGGIM
jgi:hypothetical protein